MKNFIKYSILILFFTFVRFSSASENLIIIIIDGARYSETFGDADRTYIPHMSEIAKQGTIVDYFYNDSLTYTSRAIPALWCSSWTDVNDIKYDGNWTKHAVKPRIFEYYRKHLNKPKQDCYYVIKYISSLWLPSFDADYGPDYWPKYQRCVAC